MHRAYHWDSRTQETKNIWAKREEVTRRWLFLSICGVFNDAIKEKTWKEEVLA
jgi:hypothetical protein